MAANPPGDALLARLRSGDPGALAEFLESRRPQLTAYVEHRLGAALRGKVEPADVIQETAVAALNALPRADLSGRDPFGWLCQIAEQRIIDLHRRFFGAQKRAAERESPLDAPAGSDGKARLIDLLVVTMTTPSMAVVRDERVLRLSQALEALPEEGRTALRLRYVENLPSKEIAARLGKTDGAVRVLLSRMLGRLQGLLGDAAAP
jgi:RNA polymerase sigma-70 factor (ECF subfamily)